MSKPGHNSGKGGPVDAAKLTAFADRLRNLRDGFKDDVQTLMSDAGEANIEGPALRRLVSWMAQDHVKRAEKDAIDEQYRFLAGERATPATPPAGSMLSLAIDLYRNEATVRTVAETLQVSVGKAASLRSQAAAFIVHVHENVNTPKARQMEAGEELKKGDPRLTCRNYFINTKQRGVRTHHRVQFALLIKAWNAHVTGRDVTQLKFVDGEEFPQFSHRTKVRLRVAA